MSNKAAGSSDKQAMVSMILGLVSILCMCFTGIPAIILGVLAFPNTSSTGKTHAQIGIGSGTIMTIVSLCVGLFGDHQPTQPKEPSSTNTPVSVPLADPSVSVPLADPSVPGLIVPQPTMATNGTEPTVATDGTVYDRAKAELDAGNVAVAKADWVEASRAYWSAVAEVDKAAQDDAQHAELVALRDVAEKGAKNADAKIEKNRVAQEKTRLAKREFVKVLPDSLYEIMLYNSNGRELWETKYQEHYVRWSSKFIQEDLGILSQFQANAGDSISFKCTTLDESQTRDKLDSLARWQPITVEGKLINFKKDIGEQRAEVIMSECIVK